MFLFFSRLVVSRCTRCPCVVCTTCNNYSDRLCFLCLNQIRRSSVRGCRHPHHCEGRKSTISYQNAQSSRRQTFFSTCTAWSGIGCCKYHNIAHNSTWYVRERSPFDRVADHPDSLFDRLRYQTSVWRRNSGSLDNCALILPPIGDRRSRRCLLVDGRHYHDA